MNKIKNANAFGEIITFFQAAERFNLGVCTVRKLAKESGSGLRIGRSYRINAPKFYEYLCSFTIEKKEQPKAEEKPLVVEVGFDK